MNAHIPEDIHSTLRRAGVIKGNTYNKEENDENWIEEKDWVYYKEFFAPETLRKKNIFLNFEGLDTFCDIYLNGTQIGYGNNMHIQLKLDIGSTIRLKKRNVIVIRFYSPIKCVENMDTTGIFSITTSDRIFARKAQMNYSFQTLQDRVWRLLAC